MRILVTAIGSMSASRVISSLQMTGHYVVGTDIYPKEYHEEGYLCNSFVQVPYYNDPNYCATLIDICRRYKCKAIIPLTDPEIDVINANRALFEEKKIALYMQSSEVLDIARNKLKIHEFFKDDNEVNTINTYLLSDFHTYYVKRPWILKKLHGRSSEGVVIDPTINQLLTILNMEDYVIQPYLDGHIFTVDYIRDKKSGFDYSVAREELIRTSNGAGVTVKTIYDKTLADMASFIGKKLDINGSINIEFIKHNDKYYLMDINPRFSGGIDFSYKCSGYDFVLNHCRCFCSDELEPARKYESKILIKSYEIKSGN